MRNVKKALGIVLVLAMLLNIVALASFAMTADTVCELTLVADKEYYAPGDEITLTVYGQTAADCEYIEMAGQYIFGYDSAAIAPYSNSSDLTQHGFSAGADHASAFDNSMSEVWFNDTLTGSMGTSISNGDKIICYGVSQLAETYVSATAAPVELFSFKMKVADTAANGEYEIAFNRASWEDYNGTVNDKINGGIAGPSGTEFGFAETNMWAFNDATIKVGAPTASSFVQYSKAQIRFAGIGATSTAADYKGTFDVRTVAKISQADFLANFTDEATAKEKITDVGFVYATAANVADFNLDTAKAVAEGTAADGYVKKAVSYIQHTGDGADYVFTCLIENIADADKDQTVNCLGYVCFDGTYYYFDAAATVSFNNLYTTYFPAA